jgi:hypothetical protein
LKTLDTRFKEPLYIEYDKFGKVIYIIISIILKVSIGIARVKQDFLTPASSTSDGRYLHKSISKKKVIFILTY